MEIEDEASDNTLGMDDKNLFIDPRDGERCKTVQIGDQIWMSENIRFKVGGG